MKVAIEITKKYFFILCAIIVVCSGVIVFATNSGNPGLMGHTGDEIVSLPFNKITSGTTDLGSGTLGIVSSGVGLDVYGDANFRGDLAFETIKLTNNKILFDKSLNGYKVEQNIYHKVHQTSCRWVGGQCITADGATYFACNDYENNIEIGKKANYPCNNFIQSQCENFAFPSNYYTFCIGFDITN